MPDDEYIREEPVSGYPYELINTGWFKPGQQPWNKGIKGKSSHMYGRKHSLGRKPWNKGVTGYKANNGGEKHASWKGDEVGYKSLHEWIRKYKPKVYLCEICKSQRPRDLANISGKYKRDIDDYRWLCRRCHMLSDGRIKK